MNTIVKSATQTVEIGKGQPFVIIGERINPTGRKLLAKEMQEGNFDRVVRDAKAQIEAGAHILDVNCGVPSVDPETTEPEMMTRAVELVQSVVDAPLAIDSSVVSALIAGIKAANGRPIVNSVTGEEERMESILPVVAEYGLPVIAITSDERGILFEAKERFGIAKKIVERAATYGIKPEDVLIDPLGHARELRAQRRPGRLCDHAHGERGTRLQHRLRGQQHQLRAAQSPRHQQRLHGHGHRHRHDVRHHESAGGVHPPDDLRGRRAHGQRRVLHELCDGHAQGRTNEMTSVPDDLGRS